MSDEIFIRNIKIKEIYRIKGMEIPLGNEKRKHLILTGKNGSGKTTLLKEINKFLEQTFTHNYQSYKATKLMEEDYRSKIELDSGSDRARTKKLETQWKNIKAILQNYGEVDIDIANNDEISEMAQKGEFIIAYFDAKRSSAMNVPSGIQQTNFLAAYKPTHRSNSQFIQYIVNLKAQRSFARDDGDDLAVKEIDAWFKKFETQLGNILNEENLRLEFDREKYNFNLIVENKPTSTIDKLSDGYSAVLAILTEIIIRSEVNNKNNNVMQGIVIIDEMETHLHVDLQKKILPLLTDFFPKIQFIVSTHSPFVLSSISDAIIFDLQDKIITEDLSGYSYDAIIESYFSSDKYSNILKEKIKRYELLSMENNYEDRDEFLMLKDYFAHLPKYLSKELDVKLQQIELSMLDKK